MRINPVLRRRAVMRKVLISLAAAGSALAFATPAAAQYYPQPQRPGYGQGYGYNNYGNARALQARVDRIQMELRRLAQFRMISRGEYNNRQQDAREIERRLRRETRDGYGLNPREVADIQRRIARLEYRIQRDLRDGRRYAYRW
jgi:hypothetical protein